MLRFCNEHQVKVHKCSILQWLLGGIQLFNFAIVIKIHKCLVLQRLSSKGAIMLSFCCIKSELISDLFFKFLYLFLPSLVKVHSVNFELFISHLQYNKYSICCWIYSECINTHFFIVNIIHCAINAPFIVVYIQSA